MNHQNKPEQVDLADSPLEIARAVAAIASITAVPSMLRILCGMTGMGFSAVARVTDGSWTACAVEDRISFGLEIGGQLPLHSTLCVEARAARRTIAFDHASSDLTYRDHHTPRIYNIESYISVPIVLSDGEYFGNLCAIDPQPHKVADPRTVEVFERFAELIGMQLEGERRSRLVERELLDEKAANQLQEHFIAVLGHDLRNPIASIAMTGEILSRGKDPKVAALGERLRTTTKRMGKLIDNLADLARGRLGGGMGLLIAPQQSISTLLLNVVEELRLAHPERSIHTQLNIVGTVHCDAGRVQQLLSNLLGNALTYGAKDQPIMVSADISGSSFEIAVHNEGTPIPADVQLKLFEPYWRPSTSAPGGGLGLGLYICAQIAREHLGTIMVNSTADGGTLFLVSLPIGSPGAITM